MSSLLFKRQQNIEENNKKLESLGFFSSIFSNPIINPTITSSKTESISTPRSITQEFSLPNYKRNFYPYRVTQASDLYSHLSIDTSLTPFPALITGPPGQGKSSITNEILSQLAIPSSGAAYPRLLIHIRCRIYKDTRSFIIGVWTIIGESFQEYLSNRKSEDRPIPATLTMSLFEKLTIPKNFGDLCTVLRKFLSEVNQKLDDVNNQSNYTNKHNITNNNNNRYGSSTNISSGSSASSSYSNNNNNTGRKSSLGGSAWMRPVYIQFDHINSLELFEPGLMQVVLELPKLSYSGLRVVGTCAYIPGHVDTQQGLLIRFAPYTALQIAEILRFKVRKCYEKIEIKNISNNASNTGHTPTVSPGATAIATFARSFMGSGESPIPSTNNGPNKLKSMMAIIDHEKAMHFFLAYSSHIDILYQLIISVNSILCDEAETRSSKIRGGGGGGNVELTYAQIENAVRAVLNPSSRPMTTISTSNAAISSSSNATSGRVFSFINDGSALGVALAEKERLKEQSIWVKSIPLSQQFLILSVFLAASNPKQSDAFTFGASNRGRRKLSHTDLGRRGGKKRKSSDGDDLDDPITESAVTSTTSRNKTKRSTIHSSSSYPDPNITGQDNDYDDNDDGNGRGDISNSQIAKDKKEFSQTNSRKFSLERVFGIMGQVACHCGVHVLNGGEQAARALGRSVGMIDVGMTVDQVMSSYGGSQLFAQVKLLIEQNLVGTSTQSGSWDINGAALYSRIPREMADAIAASLQFPLQDFIHHED